jgi:two-component system sensor histidine kinase MtrB
MVTGATALLLGTVLGFLAYGVIRRQLVDERERAVLRQTYTNARLVRTGLRAEGADVAELLAGLQLTSGGTALLNHDGQWFGTSGEIDRRDLPNRIQAVVESHHAAHQLASVDGQPALVAGVPIGDDGTRYYQVVPFDDIDRTLSRLGASLTLATAVATVAAVAVGAATSGAVLRPLRRMADAARRIRAGELDVRLSAGGDPDLRDLEEAFNEMLAELQARIDREVRFASDVAHEVRGPLMVLSSAVEVVNRRRADLPERAVFAVDALQEQVETFNQLVLDLLEISRFDAGAATLQCREFDLVGLIRDTLETAGCAKAQLTGVAELRVVADPRRAHRAIANLVENAERYANGVTRVHVEVVDGSARVAVEDHGPGVAPAERERIFDRFQRGGAGTRRGAPSGTGLGLALVREHVELHGGQVRLEANDGAGTRFVIELPLEQP